MERILVIACTAQEASARLAKMLCERLNWPMAELRQASPERKRHGNWPARLSSLLRRQDPIVYAGPPVDEFDVVVLVAPASAYKHGGAMCDFLSNFSDFRPDVVLLTVQGDGLLQEGAARVADSTGRYPVLGMWLKPLELDLIGCERRIQAFGQAVLTMR